jgi:DNA-binding NarL/FixJ family response regulator
MRKKGKTGAANKSRRRGVSSPSATSNHRLTKRQQAILELIWLGAQSRDIARELGKSVRTIEADRVGLMRTLGVTNVAQLLRVALLNRLVSLH